MSAETPPERPDAIEGKVTYSLEYLLSHPRRLRELLNAPDGTPGKEAAVRATHAAPLVQAGVKYARDWDRLHEHARSLTKHLADVLARLRTIYVDREGRADMAGRSYEYRSAAAAIYQRAGLSEEKTKQLHNAVRYHLSDSVRKILREEIAGSEEEYLKLCKYYKLNPKSVNQRRRAINRAKDGANLPALSLPADDPGTVVTTAVRYMARAVAAIPDDVNPSDVPEHEREDLRQTLEEVQARTDALLSRLAID